MYANLCLYYNYSFFHRMIVSGVWIWRNLLLSEVNTEPGIWMDYQKVKKYRLYNYIHGVYIPGIIQNIWTVQLLIVGIWMDWTHYLGIIIHHGHFQITHADFKNVFSNGQYNHVSSFCVHMYLSQGVLNLCIMLYVI